MPRKSGDLVHDPYSMSASYYGYVHCQGCYDMPEVLEGSDDVYRFLRDHLYDEEVRITDAGDNLIFHAVDGVDVYSRLGELGIDLSRLYRELQEEVVVDEQQVLDPASERSQSERVGAVEDWEASDERPDRDRHCHSFGLSPGEMLLHQAVKRACLEAETVRDVTQLLRHTSFDAFFESQDGSQAWGYFSGQNWWATVMQSTGSDGWMGDASQQVELEPATRVRYVSSSEDMHRFVLLDTPSA